MANDKENPYDNLKRIFHEPNRLAIMSALCSVEYGLTFKELKEACNLTDGNLSRHLKALEEADAVRIEKRFLGVKPRTTVYLSGTGIQHFNDYLEALAEVLEITKASMKESGTIRDSGIINGETARA